jgi:hypothetical protein
VVAVERPVNERMHACMQTRCAIKCSCAIFRPPFFFNFICYTEKQIKPFFASDRSAFECLQLQEAC